VIAALVVIGAFAAGALVVALAALRLARRAEARSATVAVGAAGAAFAAQPTREERIAWARGHIAACAAAEMALAEHQGELPAAMLLATQRGRAAHARHELRLLGVEA